jgi:monoterpene epsilon-lactone hydrolase
MPGPTDSQAPASGDRVLTPKLPPAPRGASAALREEVGEIDVSAPERAHLLKAPETTSEWLALIEGDAAAKLENLAPILQAAPAAVEPGEIGGVPVHHVTPDVVEPAHEDHLFVHVHGGGWILNGGLASVAEALAIALGLGIPTVSIDYRMPPQHPSPAAVDDVLTVYREVRETRSAASIAMGGSSAGGNITLCSVQRLIEQGLRPPGALFVGTPAVDLTKTGDSRFTNEGVDRHLPTWDGTVHGAALLYAGDVGLDHPQISPIFGSFDGFPPTLLASGTRDLLLSDTARVHIALRQAGAAADLLVYEGGSHADYLVAAATPESRHFLSELDRFLIAHLRSAERRSATGVDRLQSVLDMGVG